MSTTKDHYCDLCNDRVHDRDGIERTVAKPGIGILFVGRSRIERKQVNQTARHLCMDCLCNIRDMLASQFAGFDFSDEQPSDTASQGGAGDE